MKEPMRKQNMEVHSQGNLIIVINQTIANTTKTKCREAGEVSLDQIALHCRSTSLSFLHYELISYTRK